MNLVLIPGIQGRWEWMAPAVDALSKRFRVITFTLCPDPEEALDQIDREMDAAGVDRAVICGVSLGGMIALHYAAKRPDRVAALVLASTPGPAWAPDRIQAFCARCGSVSAPIFFATSVVRLLPEVRRARGGWLAAIPFVVRHGARVLTHPASPRRMRQRLAWWQAIDRGEEARRITAPTLVITGVPDLDRVVPVEGTREYARSIRNARLAAVENTGHLGVITRADRFAEIVAGFVEDAADSGTGRAARSAAR
jgi:pimeloyl-ACP methyl ester carboxylesterase